MTRKILSFSKSYDGFSLPDIGLPTSAPVVGVKTHYVPCLVFDENGEVVGEEMQKVEDPIFDDDWVFEPPMVHLYSTKATTCGGAGENCEREYYSIHENYTMEILQSAFYVPNLDSISDPDSPEEERYAGDLELLQTTTEEELFSLRFETDETLSADLGENYLEKILIANQDLRAKYLEDSSYVTHLGITTSLNETQQNTVNAFSGEVGGNLQIEPSQNPNDNINFADFNPTPQ